MHIPVLLHEVMEVLRPQPGEFFIDGTLGAGGHTTEIIRRIAPGGRLLAVDRDKTAVEAFIKSGRGAELADCRVATASYAQLPELLTEYELPKADGLLLDLGFSSDQIERSGRGFSFSRNEPLLMTYDDATSPVRELLTELSQAKLAELISEFGEERYAVPIAAAIKAAGRVKQLETTGELREVILRAVPANYEHGRIHPATRTFQALRIYANDELGELKRLLPALPAILRPGARIAIISFHSLEDRIVKEFFAQHIYRKPKRFWALTGERPKNDQELKVGYLSLITKKPLQAQPAEVVSNPRSRSAKLRAAVMVLA